MAKFCYESFENCISKCLILEKNRMMCRWKHLNTTSEFETGTNIWKLITLSLLHLLTGSIAGSASHRYSIYSKAHFEVFRHVAPMRVKFGIEEGTFLSSMPLHAKFHPHRCNDKGVGPPKLKFLLRFDQSGVSLAWFSQNLQSLYPISGCFRC